MNPTPLPIKEAIQLNKLLSPYLPEKNGEAPIEFIGKIIENIKESGQHTVYLEALALMYHTTVDEIIYRKTSSEDALKMFVEGLETNRIVALHQFCEKLGL